MAYVSDRSGEGTTDLWVQHAAGGQPVRLSRGAETSEPSFSPDGQWIAFWVGECTQLLGNGGIYVAPASGGEPRVVQATFHRSGHPIWSGEAVLFSARVANNVNLWEMTISRRTWRATRVRQLAAGTGSEVRPWRNGTGMVYFASLTGRFAIWNLPLRTNLGRPAGEMKVLTQGAAIEGLPSLAADASKLAFVSNRQGHLQVWLKRLQRGKEIALTPPASDASNCRISADGSTVAYRLRENESTAGPWAAARPGDRLDSGNGWSHR